MSSPDLSSPSKTVLVVEDHPIFVGALKQLIQHHYPSATVHTVATCEAAVGWLSGLLEDQGPDLILCDLGLPDVNGLEVVKRVVRVTQSPVMVISAEQGDDIQLRVQNLGAVEFVSKRADSEALLAGLSKILGPVVFSVSPSSSPALNQSQLSASQNRVARLLVQGHPNKEIAKQLDLGSETVKTHVREIMVKVGARNRTEAVLKLLQVS